MKKSAIVSTVISIIITIIIIFGTILIVKTQNKNSGQNNKADSINNVSIVDGKQIVKISAKGGYQPRKSVAKAGIPTIIRFDTRGTFDCSSAVRIPSMNISKNLPQTGITDIDIGSQQTSDLQGTCGMGMYPFEIEFK